MHEELRAELSLFEKLHNPSAQVGEDAFWD
jgi:hypothetical protein